ncbi:MAG TPA: N,N-dimethylformamidase beta subunit family domain-containing protein, partial [Myxococcaceae bacterium]|nr:N,N-dimethylformamidase beta subunit family domain-containing protein [Myxococcaceae bacterium]
MTRIGGVAIGAVFSSLLLVCCRDSALQGLESQQLPKPAPTAASVGPLSSDDPNPIQRENLLPGNPYWQDGSLASGQLEIYLSTDSQTAGGFVSVKISSDVPARVSAEIYRLGWYGGAGARLVFSGGPYNVSTQPTCPRTPGTNRVECNWGETFFFQVADDWLSGVFLVKAKRLDGEPYKRFAPFVVRDRRPAELMYQPTFNTYQAYNAWGGASLYRGVAGRAVEVSYDRPYEEGEGAGQLFAYDYPFLRFLEKNGYDVTYATNLDF